MTQNETYHQSPPSWVRRVLGVPLLWKLIGANALLAGIALGLAVALGGGVAGAEVAWPLLAGALAVGLLLNLVLVFVALRPLTVLEEVAAQVQEGDLGARMPAMLLADRDMRRVGHTLNQLLDRLTSDRQRVEQLATLIIEAQDQERARIARELHDSTGQTLTALVLQLSAAARRAPAELADRLATARELAGTALEEVRVLSHTIHPRILDELGLVAALDWLARQTREHEGDALEIDVSAECEPGAIPPATAAALYRVAQEALRNAVRHAGPRHVRLELMGDQRVARLEVRDDGRGFDVAEAERRRPGMGLFSIRERMTLVNGTLRVASRPGAGTRITATVPLRGAAPREERAG